jgi:hypothetical protein
VHLLVCNTQCLTRWLHCAIALYKLWCFLLYMWFEDRHADLIRPHKKPILYVPLQDILHRSWEPKFNFHVNYRPFWTPFQINKSNPLVTSRVCINHFNIILISKPKSSRQRFLWKFFDKKILHSSHVYLPHPSFIQFPSQYLLGLQMITPCTQLLPKSFRFGVFMSLYFLRYFILRPPQRIFPAH